MTTLLAALITLSPARFAFPNAASFELPPSFRTAYGVEAIGGETAENAQASRVVPHKAPDWAGTRGLKLGASLQAERTAPREVRQSADVSYTRNYLDTSGRLNEAAVRRLRPTGRQSDAVERARDALGSVRLRDLPIARVEAVTVNGRAGYRVRYGTKRDRDGDALALGQVAAVGPSGWLLVIEVSSLSPKGVPTITVDAALDAALWRLASGWRWRASPVKAH